jgi:hypothetical protein
MKIFHDQIIAAQKSRPVSQQRATRIQKRDSKQTGQMSSIFSFEIDISDENCSQQRHAAFQKSLEMGFLERQKISNFKMKYL